MKILITILSIIVLLMVTKRLFANRKPSSTEQHNYKVLKNYDTFEIRAYAASNLASVQLSSASYSENSGNGFRQLAGYIFGGNQSKQKIAMTSPVEMEMDEKMTMKFFMPGEYELEDLPHPNNPDVRIERAREKIVAAIRFGGWANDQRIQKHVDKLKTLLEEQNIEPIGNYSFLGYNAPYDMVDRRNEIIVEVKQVSIR